MEDKYKKIREEKGLPRVGQSVKSIQHGTIWKVIEEKEMWIGLGRIPGRKPVPSSSSGIFKILATRTWP